MGAWPEDFVGQRLPVPRGPEPLKRANGLVSELIERVVAHHWALSSMPAHAPSRTVVFQPFPAASTVVHFLRSRVPAWGHGEESGRRTSLAGADGRGLADRFYGLAVCCPEGLIRFAEPAGEFWTVSPGSIPTCVMYFVFT